MKNILVVAALIKKNNNVLIARRSTGDENVLGKWEFPGGKVEPNETVDLRLYECEYISGEFKLHDHSEYKWVNINELLNYDLALADIPLAKYITNN